MRLNTNRIFQGHAPLGKESGVSKPAGWGTRGLALPVTWHRTPNGELQESAGGGAGTGAGKKGGAGLWVLHQVTGIAIISVISVISTNPTLNTL